MVQRYDPDINCHFADDGDYVEYEEYEKLVRALQYLVADHPAGLLPNKPQALLQAVEALKEVEKPK